jgi:hypothetical protein
MADDEEPGDEQGKVLPLREMMSLISTDPADQMYSTLVPVDPSDPGPASGQKPPLETLPVEPPDEESSA